MYNTYNGHATQDTPRWEMHRWWRLLTHFSCVDVAATFTTQLREVSKMQFELQMGTNSVRIFMLRTQRETPKIYPHHTHISSCRMMECMTSRTQTQNISKPRAAHRTHTHTHTHVFVHTHSFETCRPTFALCQSFNKNFARIYAQHAKLHTCTYEYTIHICIYGACACTGMFYCLRLKCMHN